MVVRRPPPPPLNLSNPLPRTATGATSSSPGYDTNTTSTPSTATKNKRKQRKTQKWNLLWSKRKRLTTPVTPATSSAASPTGASRLAATRTQKKKKRRDQRLYPSGMSSSASSMVPTPTSSALSTRPGTPHPQLAPAGTILGTLDRVTEGLFGFGKRKRASSAASTTPAMTPATTQPTTPVTPGPMTPSTPSSTSSMSSLPPTPGVVRKRPTRKLTANANAIAPPERPASTPPVAGTRPPPMGGPVSPKRPLRHAKSASQMRPKVQHPLISRSAPLLRSSGEKVVPHRPYAVRSLFDPSQERVPKTWHYGPSRALVIGLSYKRTPDAARPLNGTTNDARKVCQMLLDMGYPEDEIGLMLDDDPRFKTPSTKDVMQAIKWLIDGATSNHRLFFYFAGHGSQIRDEDGDELDGRDEVLRMTDGYIVDDWLNAEMLQPLPEGCNFTALLDCCHSGTALDLPHNYDAFGSEVLEKGPDDSDKSKASTKDDEIFTMNSVMKRTRAHAVLFSACADMEVAWDAKFEDDFGVTNKGLFTEYFVRNVYNKMLDVNRAMTYKQLLYDTSWDVVGWCHANRHRLPNKRKYQTPQLSCGKPLDVNSPVCM